MIIDDGSGEPPRAVPPRSRIAMPDIRPSFLIGYGVVVISGAALSVYVVFWLNAWLGAIFGALAALCAFLPAFAWREYLDEARLVHLTNERMESHTVATQGYLEIQLDRVNAQWMREIGDVLVQRDALQAENDRLKERVPAHDPKTGRFISRRPAPLLIEGCAETIPTLEGPPRAR